MQMQKTKILVTGASGYVGARLFRDLGEKYDSVGTYFQSSFNENLVQIDITDLKSVRTVFEKYKPEFVVHNAAFPVTPQTDEQKEILKKLNYRGVDNVAQVVNEIGAKLIFISSAVALNKNDIYGQSKAHGEEVCNKTPGNLIIRPHTVFGYSPNMVNDRSFNRLLKNVYKKTPAAYDTSWKFQPTYVGHISSVIAEFVDGNIHTNLIGVAFETLKSKYNIGKDILENFGISVTPIDEKSTRPTIELDLDFFSSLHLPVQSYEEMIATMVKEIKAIGDKYPL